MHNTFLLSFVADKSVDLERSMNDPNDKFASMLAECNTKDDLVMKHAEVAGEAIAGWEKAEAEATFLKRELDEVLQQREAAGERISNLDAALKECMQQFRLTREEQEQRMHDAIVKITREHGKEKRLLEEKLEQISKKLAVLGTENSHLSRILQKKENLIESLGQYKSQAEADANALMSRLQSKEKTNASLRYNVHLLEKELQVLNEERESILSSADASCKEHTESLKKITKLEKECHRLRLQVQKELPGPAALRKIKSEVDMLGKEPDAGSRGKLDPPMANLVIENSTTHHPHDSSTEKINFLIEQLCAMEEENTTLKESITKKNNEIQSLKSIGSHMELPNDTLSHYLPIASASEARHADEISCAQSCTSSFVSELELSKDGKLKGSRPCNTVGVSDISLMDDFVEMERLARVTVDKTFGSSGISSLDSDILISSLEPVHPSQASGMELCPVTNKHLSSSDISGRILSNDISYETYSSSLQDIIQLVLRQNHIPQKSPDEILEEVRIAVVSICQGSSLVAERENYSRCSSLSCTPHNWDSNTGKPPNVIPMANSFQASLRSPLSKEISTPPLKAKLSKSIHKVIELIEGIAQPSFNNNSQILPEDNRTSLPHKSATSTDYIVRTFQWKNSELGDLLQRFVQTCNDLLNGKANLENFAEELSLALDWILNHCFTIQDVSSMRDEVMKQFDWNNSQSDSETEELKNCRHLEEEKGQGFEEELLCLHASVSLNGQSNSFVMDKLHFTVEEENSRLKQKLATMESLQNDLEEKLQSATKKLELSMIQLRDFEESVRGLQAEIESSNQSKRRMEDQIENHKLLNEHVHAQLTNARVDLHEVLQKSFSLEVDLKNKVNSCQELQATCLRLQLQLNREAWTKCDTDQEKSKLQNDWEITAASEKLAECQETILSLGNQLKAMTSPKEVPLLENVVSSLAHASKNRNRNRRSTLLDQMLAEDSAKPEDFKSPETKEIICNTVNARPKSFTCPWNASDGACSLNSQVKSREMLGKCEEKAASGQALAVVYSKRCGEGGNIVRKLFMRRNRNGRKKSITMVR